MLGDLVMNRPDDPLQSMIEFLKKDADCKQCLL